MSKLVIVESPAKAKTIQKYLGKGYDVIASMGHVRDLPENRLSVDVKKHFQPKYTVIKGKEKLVEELEKMADKSEAVFLATDPDREGEAISWHLPKHVERKSLARLSDMVQQEMLITLHPLQRTVPVLPKLWNGL